MTAESSPNHSSEEQQGFIYDDPNKPLEQEQEYDPNYVPEREFVLMPLFRRIGDILGLRRHREDQDHIYAPASAAPQTRVIDLDSLRVPPPQSEVEGHDQVQSAGMHAEIDLLGIEPEIVAEPMTSEQPEPGMAAEIQEPEAESVMTVSEVQDEPDPVIVQHESIVPETMAQVSERSLAVPIVASDGETTASPLEPVAARDTRTQPAPARPVLTQEDIAQLIAPITEAAREAAAKISAAMSQAAEWLHTKEEEIRRRAEQAVEAKRAGVSQASVAEASKWESDRAPALQREAAWVESGGIPVARAKQARPLERRPVVLKPKRPALWKRVNWAQEFTPKRVAVLGGVAMAMLMVVGVSLARRPASSVLPQEQQTTHVIQPGGVTLTTHPRTMPVTTPATTQASHANPTPPVRNARRAEYNDGPEVVTHYYNKQKPSPAHQSTVAGVKHYSDMESR